MPVDAAIREFLLDPALAGTLSAPLDRFVLHAKDGDIELAAQLRSNPEGKGFILELRDEQGRDISEFFPQKTHYSQEDGIRAEAWLDGRFPIEVASLFRPTCSTRTLIGIPQSSRATLATSKISISANSTDHFHSQVTSPSERRDATDYSHFAILRKTKLRIVNKGVKESLVHPFFGEMTSEREDAWIGGALGGECCLHQAGEHLEVHFRHQAKSDEAAMTAFWCFIDAVSMIHSILPWPAYRQHRREGALMERELFLPGAIPQGGFEIFRKQDTYGDVTYGGLLERLSELFHKSDKERRKRLRRLLWVFRGADTNTLPFPAQLTGVCTVVEGLVELLLKEDISAPEDFLALRKEATEWATARQTDNPHAKRLAGYIKGWHFQDRRTSWHIAFQPLFPGKQGWLNEIFRIFNNYRHGLAHGNFDQILTDDSHGDLRALSRLAGFVNLVFAALSGFKGRLLEAPFGDQRIDLGTSVGEQMQTRL